MPRPHPPRAAGASLIAVIIAVSILAIVCIALLGTLSDRLKILGKIRGQESITQVQSNLQEKLSEIVGDFVEESRCGQHASTYRSKFFGEGIVWSDYFPASGYAVSWLKPSDVDNKWGYTDNSGNHDRAKNRCKVQQSFETGFESFDTSSKIYFCLLLSNSAGAAQTAFAKKDIFVEVAYNFWNMKLGQGASCASLITSAPDVYERGGRLFYSLYWRTGKTAETHFHDVTTVAHVKMHD